jgi:hypothetical protein
VSPDHAHRTRSVRGAAACISRKAALVLAPCVALLAVHTGQARAVVHPAVTIDGPSQDIAGFGGVAMAADGTGGLVYLKRVEGVPHVFVSRYVNHAWQPPIQVDVGQPFAAGWPRIGAASGGELVVVWATPVATEETLTVYEMLGATLHPGASSFGPAKLIDRDVRYGTGLSPDLAMSSTGQADLVYRVVQSASGRPSSIPLLRPGDVVEQVRVAHFEGETWSRLGAINRDQGVSMRAPTEANAPQIAIDTAGDALVVWQEPSIDGVARIWARRVFSRTLNYVLPVSATSFNGVAINDDADAPSVAISPTGEGEVAYRQTTSPGSPLPGPRIFLNTLPDGFSGEGSRFAGATLADPSLAAGLGSTLGPPSIDTDGNNDIRLLYDANGAPRVIAGTAGAATAALALGQSFGASEPAPASVMNPEGGGVSAWPSADAAGPGVTVREDFPAGGAQTALLRGGIGGPVDGLDVGRSSQGEGLLGFMQGPLGNAAIAGADVTAPPARFLVSVPAEWVRPRQAAISWSAAPTTNPPVSYAIVRDGRVQPVGAGTQAHLNRRGLSSGAHVIQVLATDSEGQSTLTVPRTLRIDGQPPTVTVRQTRDGSVSVSVADRMSGVKNSGVSVSFGDGDSARGHARTGHRYGHPGRYTIVVHAVDRVGNGVVVRRTLRVG